MSAFLSYGHGVSAAGYVSCASETIVSYMYGQNHVLFVRYGE